MEISQIESGYAPIHELEMYYEIHGRGRPLVLLHGGYTTIQTSFALLLPALARNHRVIAPEQQGHGRTADIDRELSIAQMAADTAGLLIHLDVGPVDVFGYSMGGCIALGLAALYPERVGRLAVLGTNFNNQGLRPAALAALASPDPDRLPPELRAGYEQVAPRPADWPVLVSKVAAAARDYPGWPAETLRSIRAPALVMVGDQDIVRPEHAVELYRLLPDARLAVLPMTHHDAPFQRAEWILAMLAEFFDAA